jgi:DNA-binding PadR family transcriptional regulator
MLREGSWLHILNELEKEGFITITHDRKWIRLNKIK